MRKPTFLLIIGLCVARLSNMGWSEEPKGLNPIDWGSLKNPVLVYPNWSVKDFDCHYHEGVYYLFFSAFYENQGQVRSHIAEVSTRDFKTYSEPILNFSGMEEGWIGMCSPCVARIKDSYYLCFNSWGDKEGKVNQLFYMKSIDLVNWEERKPLAANITSGTRAIDAAIAFANDKFYLIWKEKQKTRLACAKDIDGDFAFVGSGRPTFDRIEGEDEQWHENYELIQIDGKWHLHATSHDRPAGIGSEPFLYQMAGDGSKDEDWLTWIKGRHLAVPQEDFNQADRANASALRDWRKIDGYFYLIYAGKNDKTSYLKRGWNKLGLARSKDLIHWLPAGQLE